MNDITGITVGLVLSSGLARVRANGIVSIAAVGLASAFVSTPMTAWPVMPNCVSEATEARCNSGIVLYRYRRMNGRSLGAEQAEGDDSP